ncbi:nuclear RNA export factor 2 [Anopheles bellator]|uniref:nuclear RNA export factor 2 n=1 Tax=Anopheles bellator TaxID=139047 RepID=UPI00264866A1|nr:nuclear RNA export factor 2 [Anopheles bellator]
MIEDLRQEDERNFAEEEHKPIILQSVEQVHDENSFYNVDSMAKQTLRMKTGEDDIVIDPKHADSLHNEANLKYDPALLNRVDVWHQVLVHHDGLCTKEKILEALFASIPLFDFFPVAYRRHANIDFFLVRMCGQALAKLFSDKLRLKAGQHELSLSVRFGAAKFQSGQIFPRSTMDSAVQERAGNGQLYGELNVLNLDSFASHSSLEEIEVWLGNRAQLEMLCSAVANALSTMKRINTLKLSNNRILHVTPLCALKVKGMQLVSLNLRGNRIRHPSSLRTLKDVKLLELYVEGNPLTDVPDYQDILCGFFPTLVKLDSFVPAAAVASATITRPDCEEEVETTSPGTLIDDRTTTPMDFQKFNMSPNWHQVTVHHEGGCGKQEILDGFADLLTKHDFFPCHYKTYSKHDEFLVRNCFDALHFLVTKKLRLRVLPLGVELRLTFAMNVAEVAENHVDPIKKLQQFTNTRYGQNCLDLNSLQKGFNEIKFVDFSSKCQRALGHILNYAARRFGSNCFIIRLRNNALQNCDALASLARFNWLVSLDLRNNSLASFAALDGLPRNGMKEVFLDFNPLCHTVTSSAEYIRQVKMYFPLLERLDGRPLLAGGNFSYCQNFICSQEAYKFADSFVRHYFSLHDSFQRSELENLYHPEAQFSMTCLFDIDHSVPLDSHQQRQVAYNNHSRNLLKIDLDRAIGALVAGNKSIAFVLNSFPTTEYDLMSFRIDVPIFTPERVLIIVHGKLKEGTQSLYVGSVSLGFTRTFYIQPYGTGKGLFAEAMDYKIYNDLFHMYTLSDEGMSFFSKREAETATKAPKDEEVCSSETEDRENAMIVFKGLTQLNREWCVRCLEESSWNLKVALNVFLKMYEARRIPKLAFVERAE